jgi:hypothetical protein
MSGSVFRRCGCTDPTTGKPFWRDCPGLAKTGHGTWVFRVDLGPGLDDKGTFRQRRPRYRSGFTTKKDAQNALHELTLAVAKGTHVDPGKMTVGQYLDEWLEGKVNLRATTRLSYERHLRLYLKPHLSLDPPMILEVERVGE